MTDQESLHPEPSFDVKKIPLGEISRTFLRYGIIGFGGPAAHLALMERELVTRRKWLSREHFLDLLAAINLVPGPTSTEMAFTIGYLAGGPWGTVMAGLGFIIPAIIFSTMLAFLYVNAGSVPAVAGILLGVKPVILVLVLSAAYRLGIKAINNSVMRILLSVSLVFVFISSPTLMALVGRTAVAIPELALLVVMGISYVLITRPTLLSRTGMLFAPLTVVAHTFTGIIQPLIPTVSDVFLRFLLIGATLFGSGYVVAVYMERQFVASGFMTPTQLVDVLAIGQATPGPVLSTAAAAGYVMTAIPIKDGGTWYSGIPAAIAGTIGVFLPAFIIVLLLGRLVPYLRRYPIVLEFLKGVNAGVIALLIGAFLTLALQTLTRSSGGLDWIALGLAGIAFVALERFKIDPTLLIVLGAIIGISRQLIGLR